MKKAEKIWLIIGAVLVLVGLVGFAGVMVSCHWDFTKLSTAEYETNTYEIKEAFDRISINVNTTEIEFVPIEDGDCSIVCFETEKEKHSASVQNDTLVIEITDTRKWYDYIGISLKSPEMTVYLPQKEYASLIIETDTGDITIPKEFSFGNLEIDGDTSDVDCFASVLGCAEVEVSTGDINLESMTAGEMNLATSTGGITLNSVTINNDIEIETDTGMLTLTDTSCKDIFAESDTGDVTMKSVEASGSISVISSTGDVMFEHSDASEIMVRTSTGDVTGTLLSDKVFITETSTGRISVPKTTSGGKCEVTTSTGDIDIEILE